MFIAEITPFSPQETDEAFFICDLRDLEQKMKLWQRELPQVTPYYGEAAPHLFVYMLHLRLRTSLIYRKEELKVVIYEGDLNVEFCRYLLGDRSW